MVLFYWNRTNNRLSEEWSDLKLESRHVGDSDLCRMKRLKTSRDFMATLTQSSFIKKNNNNISRWNHRKTLKTPICCKTYLWREGLRCSALPPAGRNFNFQVQPNTSVPPENKVKKNLVISECFFFSYESSSENAIVSQKANRKKKRSVCLEKRGKANDFCPTANWILVKGRCCSDE